MAKHSPCKRPRVLRTLILARNQLDAVTSIARAPRAFTLLYVFVKQVIIQDDVFRGVSAFGCHCACGTKAMDIIISRRMIKQRHQRTIVCINMALTNRVHPFADGVISPAVFHHHVVHDDTTIHNFDHAMFEPKAQGLPRICHCFTRVPTARSMSFLTDSCFDANMGSTSLAVFLLKVLTKIAQSG